MAEKRMVSRQILSQDQFVTLKPLTQALYIQLLVAADDDGFVNSKVVMRSVCARQHNIDELVSAGYLLDFTEYGRGLYLVTHWWSHNNKIDQRRYKSGAYSHLLDKVISDENRIYQWKTDILTDTPQTNNEQKTRIDEDKIKEDKIKEDKIDEDNAAGAANPDQSFLENASDFTYQSGHDQLEPYGDFQNVYLTQRQYEDFTLHMDTGEAYNRIIRFSCFLKDHPDRDKGNHYEHLKRLAIQDGVWREPYSEQFKVFKI